MSTGPAGSGVPPDLVAGACDRGKPGLPALRSRAGRQRRPALL